VPIGPMVGSRHTLDRGPWGQRPPEAPAI